MTANEACAAIVSHLSSYLDGELAAAECARIEAHCRGCPPCALLMASLRDTVGLCRDAGGAPLPESVRRRALERARSLLRGHLP